MKGISAHRTPLSSMYGMCEFGGYDPGTYSGRTLGPRCHSPPDAAHRGAPAWIGFDIRRMVLRKTCLERAFELASSGRFGAVLDIRLQLKSEGYHWSIFKAGPFSPSCAV